MPPHIPIPPTSSQGNLFEYKMPASKVGEYKALYPSGVDLRPGSKMHSMLRDELMQKAQESSNFMRQKHPTWKVIDETLSVYIEKDDHELLMQKKDIRRPVSIVVPESYAQLDVMTTYMLSSFGGDVIWKLDGFGPEDTLGSILLEKLLETQSRSQDMILPLYYNWTDAYKYGFGVVALAWIVKKGKTVQAIPTGYNDPYTGTYVNTGSSKEIVEGIKYEGNSLVSIDPYKFLPDPNVPVYDIQNMEHVGWKDTVTFMSLLRAESDPDSILFNVGYLSKAENRRSSIYADVTSGRDPEIATEGEHVNWSNNAPVDRIWYYWDLIPSMYGLSDRDTPEKWVFCLANDEVIIAAAPMDAVHEGFPVHACAPNAQGHEYLPTSAMEIASGAQKAMNFWYNSRIANVIQGLFHQLVVNPKVVNMPDVLSGNGVIRTRPPAWNRGIQEGIMQLQVHDVTQGHMGDLATTREIMRNTTGAVDSLQGIQRDGGERVTAAEFNTTSGNAVSRLQKGARIISTQQMIPLGRMMAEQTQQYMSEDTYVKTIGRWEQTLKAEYGFDGTIPVSPFDIQVGFDLSIHDGSTDGGEQAGNWMQLYQMVLQNPEAVQTIDTTRTFLHIARLLGEDDAQKFLRSPASMLQAQIRPDGQVQEDSNLIPMEQARQELANR